MTDEPVEDRARKERSPSFPFIPLQKAIERARQVASAHKRNPARLPMVAETWGYGVKSSGLLQTAAALKAYGLLEDIGRGDDRKIALTDLAWKILSDARPGAKEQAIKEAALRPRLIAEYRNTWGISRPTDSHCVSELTLDRGFTEDAANLFLRVYDETLSFANLKDDDSLSSVLLEGAFVPFREETHGESISMKDLASNTSPPTAKPPAIPRATLPLPEGMVALELPPKLSARSMTALKAWIDVMTTLAAEEEKPKDS